MNIESIYAKRALDDVADYLRGIRAEVGAGSGGKAECAHKEDESVVTYYDRRVEADIREILTGLDGGVGIYGEEYGVAGDTSNFWTIDPIDGTEQYVRGNPFYTCMLAFVSAGIPRAALIYNYATDELFTRLPDESTQLNGRPTRVSNRPISRAIIEFEMKRDLPERAAVMQAIDSRIYTNQKIAACAGFGMTQVIRGATEGRIQINGYGQLYDYLPGQILVDGAGGVVQTPGEATWNWANLSSLVTNTAIASECGALVAKALQDV